LNIKKVLRGEDLNLLRPAGYTLRILLQTAVDILLDERKWGVSTRSQYKISKLKTVIS